MNKVKIANTINFQYGVPSPKPDSDKTITVTANGQSIELVKDGPVQQMDNVTLFTVTVTDQFFPLSFFFDGNQFCAPEVSSDGALMATTPLSSGEDISVNVYNKSNPDSCGTIMVNFTSSADGIGVVIVGTSGLTDPEA